MFLQQLLQEQTQTTLCALDFLGKGSLTERVISLALGEIAPGGLASDRRIQQLAATLRNFDVSELNVVVLGGGTGLSNIIGGDSKRPEWRENPFSGLKMIFPNLHSIVCVTDDGGSTGELLKDFPLIALGDLRHVLLSSICSNRLQAIYAIDATAAQQSATILHALFNYRFISYPESPQQLLRDSTTSLARLPKALAEYITTLLDRLFNDPRMIPALYRPQCLGNLLLAAAIYDTLPAKASPEELTASADLIHNATQKGIAALSYALGAGENSVLPCTTTPAQLQMLYANGVLVTSESKSGSASRGYPVDRVLVEFSGEPKVPDCLPDLLKNADIIIMAPGSLYSSIIPILQVPGIANLIRDNSRALKLLIANIWVQKGETDATRDAPERRFYVSDLIQAYERNISGGILDLFSHVLTLDLADIPGSVLQRYAIEAKEPIYLDRTPVRKLGLEPVCAYIFSRVLLEQRNVIQHDPDSLALAIKVLSGLKTSNFLCSSPGKDRVPFAVQFSAIVNTEKIVPSSRYSKIFQKLDSLEFTSLTPASELISPLAKERREHLRDCVVEIIWRHQDVPPSHFQYIRGICLVETSCWSRCQVWDNVFSFYDPADGFIKIRSDQTNDLHRLEMAFLVGLGQSLLGNYAEKKWMEDIFFQGEKTGRVFCLRIQKPELLADYFSFAELDEYLQLCRMYALSKDKRLYTRLVNGQEGFTPPGLLFGLFYVWYLDNRFAPNIEYKMSIMKSETSYLIPEQLRLTSRREQMIRFFRDNVFRRSLPDVTLSR
jgi:uncharacterized cofD-like protein